MNFFRRLRLFKSWFKMFHSKNRQEKSKKECSEHMIFGNFEADSIRETVVDPRVYPIIPVVSKTFPESIEDTDATVRDLLKGTIRKKPDEYKFPHYRSNEKTNRADFLVETRRSRETTGNERTIRYPRTNYPKKHEDTISVSWNSENTLINRGELKYFGYPDKNVKGYVSLTGASCNIEYNHFWIHNRYDAVYLGTDQDSSDLFMNNIRISTNLDVEVKLPAVIEIAGGEFKFTLNCAL